MQKRKTFFLLIFPRLLNTLFASYYFLLFFISCHGNGVWTINYKYRTLDVLLFFVMNYGGFKVAV